ncbi:MAG: glutathione S-transferase N-terminal domain-containing protein [Myxococcales bacterium]|nr:glutathione S-transferase N-terminal domain-containing protein [Myxococcales bacterium]
MTDLYPSRYPVEHPDRIQLYSMATPNGRKAGITLEELELPYEAHFVDIMAGHQYEDEFRRINPNSKIPTLVDPNGPDGAPIALMESGAILLYLSQQKAGGRLIPAGERHHYEVLQWLFFQVGNVGPMFGQFGHFYKFASDKTSDSYAVERYTKETKRLLAVLDAHLEGRTFLVADEFSLADIATFPWVMALDFYDGKGAVEYDSFANVEPWIQRCLERPGVQRGLSVPKRPSKD